MTTLLIRSILVGLASYRLARALSLDTITDPFRGWLHRHAYRVARAKPGTVEPVVVPKSKPWAWAYSLASCPFCNSWWLALGVSAAWFGEWSMAFAVAAVASAGIASVLVRYDVGPE